MNGFTGMKCIVRVTGGVILVGACCSVLLAANPAHPTFRKGATAGPTKVANASTPKPATAPFDNLTNGFESRAKFDKDRDAFEEIEDIEKNGLGPVYNANSCAACHQNPVSGSSTQVVEIRAGHHVKVPVDAEHPEGFQFVEPLGGSLIHQRAINPQIQERVPKSEDVRTFRLAINVLGDGFVEVLLDYQIRQVQSAQPEGLQGKYVIVPVAVQEIRKLGQPSDFLFAFRIGRFGWKSQEASLLNFSAGAYLNEMGITSPLQRRENRSNGRDVTDFGPNHINFDPVKDPEDTTRPDPKVPNDTRHPFGRDVEKFTRFMRSTKPPPPDSQPPDAALVARGEAIFNRDDLACAICHHPQYVTPAKGTFIASLIPTSLSNAASDLPGSKVPEKLAGKSIRPFSDFMLHNIGTGDGIAQTQHAQREPQGLQGGRLNQLLDFALQQATIRLQNAIPGQPTAAYDAIVSDLAAKRALFVRVLQAGEPRELDSTTANMIRTAPLWGLRVRTQFMHDGLSLTIDDAIERHKVSAKWTKNGQDIEANLPANFSSLEEQDKEALRAFLNTL